MAEQHKKEQPVWTSSYATSNCTTTTHGSFRLRRPLEPAKTQPDRRLTRRQQPYLRLRRSNKWAERTATTTMATKQMGSILFLDTLVEADQINEQVLTSNNKLPSHRRITSMRITAVITTSPRILCNFFRSLIFAYKR